MPNSAHIGTVLNRLHLLTRRAHPVNAVRLSVGRGDLAAQSLALDVFPYRSKPCWTIHLHNITYIYIHIYIYNIYINNTNILIIHFLGWFWAPFTFHHPCHPCLLKGSPGGTSSPGTSPGFPQRDFAPCNGPSAAPQALQWEQNHLDWIKDSLNLRLKQCHKLAIWLWCKYHLFIYGDFSGGW